jgi:cell division protein FtsI/penicillin-binding protein 2
MGIGQGFILSTVLQVADMMCGVANNGLIYQPHLLRAAYSAADGKLIYKTQKKLIHNVPVSEKNLNIIKRGLHLVTVGGTARYAGRFAKISFAGKTSTSQNTFGQPHAWFSCYAPYNSNSKRRKLVVTVFIENGGGGGEAAAPIAVAILNAVYFNDDPVAVKKKIKASIEKIHYERYLRRLKEKQFMEGGGGGETDIQF